MLPPAVMAKVTSTIWTQVPPLHMSALRFLHCLVAAFLVLLWETGGSEPSDGCLEAVSRLLCTELIASHACYLIFLELWGRVAGRSWSNNSTPHSLVHMAIFQHCFWHCQYLFQPRMSNRYSQWQLMLQQNAQIIANTGNTVWMLKQTLLSRLYKRFAALDFATTALQSVRQTHNKKILSGFQQACMQQICQGFWRFLCKSKNSDYQNYTLWRD